MGTDALNIIGVTGRCCAGKNLIAQILENKGAVIIDVDALGHAALAQSTAQIAKVFGPTVLHEDSSVNRKALGKIVFSQPQQLRELEKIVHPLMVNMVVELLEKARLEGQKSVVLNAALLQRMGLDALCNEICFVNSPCIVRLIRAIKRDKATLRSFVQIEKAQKDIKARTLGGAQSVHIVANWGPKRYIYRQVDEFWASMSI
ncbi:MAG: dephospho-CoA kinase [Sphaerochaetaceae bacterium]|jgi:dephospho-CoA kinase